jgi:hypothetical protein
LVIFAMPLNPVLLERSREAKLIGRILTAYGELEYMLCKSVAECREKPFPIFRALYRIGGTTPRMEVADALAREIYAENGMGNAFADAIGALRICMSIRHQYAHCAWANGGRGRNGGLYFADLSTSAEASTGWEHHWRHVNVRLLKQQYDFFEYTYRLLMHIEMATIGRQKSRPLHSPKPPKQEPPKMHNPPERHIPQWLGEEDRQHYLKRIQEAKATVRSQQLARSGMKPKRKPKLSARQTREKKMRAAQRKRRRRKSALSPG